MTDSDHNEGSPVCDKFTDVQNWTDHKIADVFLQPTSILLELVFVPIIFAIGFVGNVAFLLLLARVKTMRTITNFYLANLAAADLMVLNLELIYRPWYYVNFNQIQSFLFYHSFGCGIFIFDVHVPSMSSIFLITIVSFDQYVAIC